MQDAESLSWPDCVQRNTVVNGIGDALMVDLSASAKEGCWKENCLSVYLYLFIYIYLYIYIYICLFIYIYIYIYLFICIYIFILMYIEAATRTNSIVIAWSTALQCAARLAIE